MSKPKLTDMPLQANSLVPGIIPYDLKNLIDKAFKENAMSPIDSFISNALEINKLFTPNPSQVLGNLIILGYVSAIESYFRAIFRKIILIDNAAKVNCEKKTVTYGAALNASSSVLPEALLEGASFASKANVLKMIKEFLDLTIPENNMPIDLQEVLDRFSEICELRHCIVHRFGKFGSNNAIKLGLDEHKLHIEKPIKCDFNALQQIISVCQNTVRIINNFLFEKIMNRLLVNNINNTRAKVVNTIWTWNYDLDKALFIKYFNIFYCKLYPPVSALTPKKMYANYKAHYHALP
jgi:hypothetical protein